MAKQTKKIIEASLSALRQFQANANIYTGSNRYFDTYCMVNYTYGADQYYEDCHVEVTLIDTSGKIEISGIKKINVQDMPTTFNPVVDVYEFIDSCLVIKGSKDKRYEVKIREYAEGSILIPD